MKSEIGSIHGLELKDTHNDVRYTFMLGFSGRVLISEYTNGNHRGSKYFPVAVARKRYAALQGAGYTNPRPEKLSSLAPLI